MGEKRVMEFWREEEDILFNKGRVASVGSVRKGTSALGHVTRNPCFMYLRVASFVEQQ